MMYFKQHLTGNPQHTLRRFTNTASNPKHGNLYFFNDLELVISKVRSNTCLFYMDYIYRTWN